MVGGGVIPQSCRTWIRNTTSESLCQNCLPVIAKTVWFRNPGKLCKKCFAIFENIYNSKPTATVGLDEDTCYLAILQQRVGSGLSSLNPHRLEDFQDESFSETQFIRLVTGISCVIQSCHLTCGLPLSTSWMHQFGENWVLTSFSKFVE